MNWLADEVRAGRKSLANRAVREALRASFGSTQRAGLRRRSLEVVRLRKATGEGVVVAYASVFGHPYRVGANTYEAIERGAFADSLDRRGGRVMVAFEHDWTTPVGYAQAHEDAHGLRVEAHLFVDEVERARAVWRAMEAGAVSEWSIGFIPQEIVVSERREGGVLETVVRADLLEASPVVKGANPATTTLEVRHGGK